MKFRNLITKWTVGTRIFTILVLVIRACVVTIPAGVNRGRIYWTQSFSLINVLVSLTVIGVVLVLVSDCIAMWKDEEDERFL